MGFDENGTAPTVEEVPVEAVDTPEVVETPEVVAPETPEGAPDTETPETPDETKTDEPEAEPAGSEAEPAPEPVTFDAADELPTVLEKVDKVLERYDLTDSPELASLIDTLKTKAESANTDVLGEYSVFGDVQEVKSLLDRQSLLYAQREDNGVIRPKTDEFAAEIVKTNPETAAWLYFDLATQPSTKYEGRNRFQELIVDAMALPNDTPNSVLARYDQFISYMKDGALPANDIPTFIPQELHQAYGQLSNEAREDIKLLVNDEYANERAPKLNELRLIQDGINARGEKNQLRAYQEQQNAVAFNQDVQGKQEAFFDTFRQTFAKDLTAQVKFSDDPKMQSLLAHQNVTLLEQAFDPTSAGDFARKVISDANIPFDNAKAQSLLKDVEVASVALVTAQRSIGPEGQVLDKIALNKATKEFENTGRKWQSFAKETLDHLARLTSTGTAEAVKAEVAKIKVAPKARAVPKGVATQAKKADDGPPAGVAYGSPEWDKYWANKTILEREASRAKSYA